MLDGSKLKFLRYLHGRTQQQVADWCNVSVRYIGLIEAGKEIPSNETYNAFLNCVYGVGEPLPKIARCNQKRKKASD